MAELLRVFFLSPEMTLFTKTGDLVDVAGWLSKALRAAGEYVNLYRKAMEKREMTHGSQPG